MWWGTGEGFTGDKIVVGVMFCVVVLRGGVALVVVMNGLSAAADGANPPGPSSP